MKKSKVTSEILGKVIAVINSCETTAHVNITLRYLFLLKSKYELSDNQDTMLFDFFEEKYTK